MHRLRKKSDTKRSPVPDHLRLQPLPQEPLPVPSLPPTDDFRTSLILPDLTRRFSLLRTSSGSPIALDDLKSKFAEQRARGSHNQVSEEEEDMILEALGRLHANARSNRVVNSGDEADGSTSSTSQQSSSIVGGTASLHNATSISSLSSARGSNVSRRMSNNLFGSGKFRDQSYLRSAGQGRRTGGSRGAMSLTPSESSMSMSTIASGMAGQNTSIYSDSQSLRPITPEGSAYTPSSSVPSSPNNKRMFERQPVDRSDLVGPRSEHVADTTELSTRLSKALSPERLQHASLALDQVIRELEEEGDDEIVMERSPIAHAPAATLSPGTANIERNSPLHFPTDYEAGTALSSDDRVVHEEAQNMPAYGRASTSSPTPRLPGYIPGMPRPMTPRDVSFDSDDQTPSTTPRATSPRLPGTNTPALSIHAQSFVSSIYRSNSSASTSRYSPAPTSPTLPSTPPLFFSRSTNGRFTPEDRQRNGSGSPVTDAFDTSRRRPISPLSGPTYQPLIPSRPTTPSNITWTTTLNASTAILERNGSLVSRGRTSSSGSVPDAAPDILERNKSVSRSVRSPALPDSPWLDGAVANTSFAANQENRPPSAMSGMDLGSPLQLSNRPLRSPTPTHSRQKSSINSMFPDHVGDSNGDGYSPKRSSRQKHSSGFSLSSSQPLVLSPIATSSHSSLESTGSSYHSWDEDHRKDRLHGLLSSLDPHYSDWHDIQDKSTTSTPGTSPYEGVDYEEVVRRETGLTKADFVAVQEKLVNAAKTKAATPDGRTRASSLRRRRPSTSQSNYSYHGADNRVASPAPQPQTSTNGSASRTVDHIAKASALLNSVVDSIESPKVKSPPIVHMEEPPVVSTTKSDAEPLSSPGRRNRALAEILFGSEDGDSPAIAAAEPPAAIEDVVPEEKVLAMAEPETLRVRSPEPPMVKPTARAPQAVLPPSPRLQSPQISADAAQLALEVQQRAEAATAALRKSPSIPKFDSSTLPRKRINPSQISSPTLVSASTSVDTIPLPSVVSNTSATPSNRIGSRFRRLRGTLRSKAPVNVDGTDERAPYPIEFRTSPAAVPTPTIDVPPATDRVHPPVVNAGDPAEPKATSPIPNPPASATPGLKGFMARFRKQRAADVYSPTQRQRISPLGATSTTSLSPPLDRTFMQAAHSAPVTKLNFRAPSPAAPVASRHDVQPASAPVPASTPAQTPSQVQIQDQTQATNDEAALKQLFDAASRIGLDQAALNDLLARSPSTSSKSTAWTSRMSSVAESRKSSRHMLQGSESFVPSLAPMSARPSIDEAAARPSMDSIQGSSRSPAPVTPRIREPADNPSNPVVRRTIIFPSDSKTPTFDLNPLARKQSASKRRRQSAGASSINSVRSIHDRVPTPPPHKAGVGRRFSADGSPPVPQLPGLLASQAENLVTPGQMEVVNSNNDSLYDMYTDGRTATPVHTEMHLNHGNADTIPESGPALEVIEMANGETIWSIVNGLRDDDGESFYGDRVSFVSEYSRRESTSEGLKVFFKGHEKRSSKGSNASFSRRRQRAQPEIRPETKVFFSSSAQIGKLIESLSREVDAGSFNISPERAAERSQAHSHLGHSASSSLGSSTDMRWTLEERLEHMLGSMNPA